MWINFDQSLFNILQSHTIFCEVTKTTLKNFDLILPLNAIIKIFGM